MIIRVRYKTGTFDMISDKLLEQHIETGRISMFYRYSEQRWIVIGRDPIRQGRISPSYEGPERRASMAIPAMQV